jgi:hypothetical protein
MIAPAAISCVCPLKDRMFGPQAEKVGRDFMPEGIFLYKIA